MSLLSQFLPKEKEKEFFLTLGIEENFIRAAVIELVGAKVKILGTGHSDFADEKSETEACDIAITMAEKAAGSDLLVEKVIFALPQIYLQGDDVKPDYLKRLKKVTKELNLKAHGFIDYSSAIAFYLENEEGSPPTVILMDITRSHLTVSLVRVGKIAQNIIVPRTDSIVEDFGTTLPQFKAEILPSRIILYDSQEKTEILKEELLKFPWHKHSIFLHTPKIEVLDNDKIMKAITEAASTSFLPASPVEGSARQQFATEEKEVLVSEPEAPNETVMMETAGETPVIETAAEDQGNLSAVKAENFGFIEEPAQPIHSQEPPPAETRPAPAAKSRLPQLKLPRFNLPIRFALPGFAAGGRLPAIALGAAVLVILVLGYFLLLRFPTATVALIVYPEAIEQNIEAVFTTEKSDMAGTIKAKTISSDMTGSKSVATTGKANIGDKAAGEVTIYNKTANSKTFTKGTSITSGSLRFTLDNEVKVASASETGEGISFGKTGAKVTALAIGPEGNLPANSEFKFADLSENSFTAKNSQAFSGGTSREIPSVSREDRVNLEKALTEELTTSAKQKLSGQLGNGERLLEEPVNFTVSAKKFSGEVGSEAKELTLDMTVKVEVYVYSQQDLEAVAKKSRSPEKAGYKLDPDKLSIKVTSAAVGKDGEIETKLKLTSYYIPEFEMERIAGDLKGKSYDEAVNYLQTVKNVGGVQIIPEKSLPFLSKKLPMAAKGISLQVISK